MYRPRPRSPEESVCGHSGRVVLLANHRYDSSFAHLSGSALARVAARSFCAGRSSLYLPMSVVDIV